MLARLIALPIFLYSACPAWTETELSLFGGTGLSTASQANGMNPSSNSGFSFGPLWQNPGMDTQPRAGLRLTWWQNRYQGWGLDLSSFQVQPESNVISGNPGGTQMLAENVRTLTINTYRKWPESWSVSPYVGAGLGFGIAEINSADLKPIGPAVQWTAGAKYPISERWSVFGEYQGSFTARPLVSNGGRQNYSGLLSNGINVGLTLGF